MQDDFSILLARAQLSTKDLRFCDLLLAGNSTDKAKEVAGVAQNPINKPRVQTYLRLATGRVEVPAVSGKPLVTEQEVIMGLKNIAINPESSDRDRISAYRLLGDYLRLFSPKGEGLGTSEKVEYHFHIVYDEKPEEINVTPNEN